MTRHFSIPTMLRMTPNFLLARFFDHLGFVLPGVDWQRLRCSDIPNAMCAIRCLPEDAQQRIEKALGDVFSLACKRGLDSLLESALLSGETWRAAKPVADPYEEAMRAYLDTSGIFEKAVFLRQVDSLSRWRRFKGLPKQRPATSAEDLESLRIALCDLLSSEQGRGERCTVEYANRASGADYFFAYPDDFVHTLPVHDDGGCLVSRSVQPTFEIVFAYLADEGALELYAKVPPKLKVRLKELFCDTMLSSTDAVEQAGAAYDLNALKDCAGVLDTDPMDHVSACIRRVTLALRNSPQRLTLDAGSSSADTNVFVLVRRHVQEAGVPLTQVDVASATFCIRIEPWEGRRAGTLTFNVTYPHGCSLRNEPPERAALGSRYLKRWGICRV